MSNIPQCGCCSVALSRDQMKKGIAVLALLGTDIAMSIVLSKLFTDTPFTFPLYLTMMHMFLSFILAAVVLRTEVEGRMIPHIQPIPATWLTACKILIQSLAFAIGVGLFNLSLKYISLMLSIVVRASIPLFTAILSMVVRRQVRGLYVWMGITGIAAGMAMTVYKNPQFQLIGFLLAGGSAITEAIFIVMAEYIMIKESLDSLNLLYYTALPSAIFVLPFFIALEGTHVVKYISNYFWMNIFIIFGTSILAFAFSISRYQVVRLTSCVYAATIQNVRIVLIVIVSEIIFYNATQKLSLLNQGGIVMTLLCFVYITFIGFSEEGYKLPSYSALHLGTKLKSLVRGNTFEVVTGDDSFVDEEDRRFTICETDSDGHEIEEYDDDGEDIQVVK